MSKYTNCPGNTLFALGTDRCIHFCTSFLRFFSFLFLLISGKAFSQAFNLDQMANGKVQQPFPVTQPPSSQWTWQNGNLNVNNAHFRESYSVPYRCDITKLKPNTTYQLRIGIDVRVGGKFALDYFTGVQNLEPHGMFGHLPEKADPLAGLNFTALSTRDYDLPAPDYPGTTVETTSFNALPSTPDDGYTDQPTPKELRIYNATIPAGGITYENASAVDITATTTEAILRVRFTTDDNADRVIIAWGGHIASEFDWPNQSAQFINGSPYHCHIRNLLDADGKELAKGSTDRSLKTDAVFRPPLCDLTGSQLVCDGSVTERTYEYLGDKTGITNYSWTLNPRSTGARIKGSSGNTVSGASLFSVVIEPSNSTTGYTRGTTEADNTFTLTLTTTNQGGTTSCSSSGTVKAKPTLSLFITQPTLCGTSKYGSLQVCSPKVGYTYDLFLSGNTATPIATIPATQDQPVIFGNIEAGTDPKIRVTGTVTEGSCSNTFDCNTASTTACATPNAQRAMSTTKTDAALPAPQKGSASVLAAPNPYNDRIRFTMNSAVSGQGSLELYNMLGQKVKTVFSGYVNAEQTQTIEYAVPLTQRSNLIYIFRVGNERVTGKLIGLDNR